MSNPTILNPSKVNWEDYKSLRLEALKLEPQAYGSSYEIQKNDPDEKWKIRLKQYIAGEGNWMFFAAVDEKLVGMIGAFQSEDDTREKSAQIIAVYVKKEYRGKGLSKLLLAELLKVLIQSGIKKARLTVNTDQKEAVSLYKAFGFLITKQERNKLGDGLYHNEFVMEKELQ